MAVQKYVKHHPPIYRPKERVRQQKAFARRFVWMHRVAPFFLVGVGVFLLGLVCLPISLSQFSLTENWNAGAEEIDTSTFSLTQSLRENLLPTPEPTPLVVSDNLDFSDLSNWFPDRAVPVVPKQQEKKYTLSIPKLGIIDAEVVYGSTNLDQHLIQYPDTAMPGDPGTPVIFGHSVLRSFYNPSENNPRRYISIFSTIMTLKTGDPIFVRDGPITYTYKVVNKTEVKPTDLYILDQDTSIHQLKIVTCTPEGTTLRRGVITAVLDTNG